ncbi:PilZ domain-containing protein [Qipengyuania soli]|uniref:PilZ domain-containing protein n=1 Tax=Qipengyuania soli TaxID=2782568 RepID=A0A7S8IUF0_9SPHN|nr:PilZ domain-containing protein [Qipengyuania soli]QPC98944.1 PilZ domain-containing protein [Qipengyuania soli]
MNEHRRIERDTCAGRIDYTFAGLTRPAHLVNMSREGCRLELSGPLPDAGDAIEITFIDGVSVSGRVVWEESGTVGVQFEQPIIEAIVRFFGLSPAGSIRDEAPKDGFGRHLPPMGQADTPH